MTYSNLISIENLFQAWEEFKKGKRKKYDVMVFERNLEDNLFKLNYQLKTKTYRHGSYQDFYVNDPKRRHIHKAKVSDRIVHHLLYKYLYNLFDKTFISDSYSCRLNKGTHRAVLRLEKFARIVSKNYTQDCWALKLDIKRFFASVDHEILKKLISKKVKDPEIFRLLNQVIESFQSTRATRVQPSRGSDPKRGIPLGNLTSQIFANIYLNQLDKFIKHDLKIKYYLRYADDFIILNSKLTPLLLCFETVKQYLENKVQLEIHPQKIILRKLAWGIDFCGYIVLPHYRLVKTKTKKRIFMKVQKGKISRQSFQSYLGHFFHAESYKNVQLLKNYFFLKLSS